MKRNHLYNTIIFTASAAVMLAAASCTDWDDHYDTAGSGGAAASLWEEISGNEQLSDFAALLQKSGYDNILSESQTYTVWAPENGTFDVSALQGLNDKELRHQFINNHIARNNYIASGIVNKKVMMLNGKFKWFEGSGSYAMGSCKIDRANTPALNGTLHIVNGQLPFMNNLYEYVTGTAQGTDSIKAYYKRYDVKMLDKEASVEGPTINGEITYLDSVMIESNRLFTMFGRSFINTEDSSYTMLIPTDKAWTNKLKTIAGYYKYKPRMTVITFDANAKEVRQTLEVDDTYLTDSLAHYALLKDLVMSNNVYGNRQLVTEGDAQPANLDSVVTVNRSVIRGTSADNLFTGARKVEMSNGYGWITDSLRIPSWDSWARPVVFEAETERQRAAIKSAGTARSVNLNNQQDPAVSGSVSNDRYLEVSPSGTYANPEVFFYLPEILSTTYSLYIITVPSNIKNAAAGSLPCKIKADAGFVRTDGTPGTTSIGGTMTTTAGAIDTLYMGDVTFPLSYAGLGDYYPYLRIRSFATRSEISGKQIDNTLRIDRIMLVPKELDDFLKATGGEYPGL